MREEPVPGRSNSRRTLGAARFLLPPNLGWILLAYAALVLLSGIAYSALRIRMDREQILQAEQNRLRAVAAALQSGTLAMLSDGLGSAVASANEIESAGGVSTVAEADLAAALAKMLAGGEYVRAIFLAEPTRFVRAGRGHTFESLSPAPDWFTAPAGDAETWVGKPLPDPDRRGHTVVPVARRVQVDRGRRIWAGTWLDFGDFQGLHAQPGTGTTAVGMISSDGTILARFPGMVATHLAVGENVGASAPFAQLLSGPSSGIVAGFAPRFGTQMIFGYDRVSGYPLTVVTAESLQSALAPWRERTFTTILVTAVSAALLLLMTVLLNHSVRAFFTRELHFRALSNHAAFSVLVLETGRVVDANETAARMFQVRHPRDLIGRNVWELSPERQPDGRTSRDRVKEIIEAGTHREAMSFEWTHRRMASGETFPAEVEVTTLITGKSTMTLAVIHDLTERQRAQQQLKESEHRYRALVDALPEAVFVHRGSDLLFINNAGLRLLGARSSEEVTGRPIVSFVAEEDRATVQARARQVLESGIPTEPWEARIRRLDGSFIWVESQGVPIKFGGEPAAQGVMHDVTARKRREAAEAARNERMQRQLTALMRLANRYDCAWTDLQACLRSVCISAAEVLAVDRVEVWLLQEDGRTLRCAELYERSTQRHCEGELLPAARLQRYLEALRTQRVIEAAEVRSDSRLQELAAGQWLTPAPASMIAAALRTAGDLTGVVAFEQLDAARRWHLDEVSFAGGIADQIAQALLDWERERVLVELRGVAGELMRVQDEERRRVGRDLHDSTGQTLAALELDLARLLDSAQSLPPPQRELLEECARLASQCSAEIRTASYLLHPPLLDELGLVSALRWLADGLRNRGGIEVRLELPESIPRLSPEEELTLFRVAQEALTNAQRHSASPWVALELRRSGNRVELQVLDGGRGIAGKDPLRGGTAAAGVGLAGMRERMRQIGGTLSVDSAGAGTRIRASIVVHPRQQVRSA